MNPGPSVSRWRRVVWIAGGLLAAYAVFGFWIAPPLIRDQLQRRGSALLGRAVTVDRVRVNPFAMSLTLENLDVRLKDGTGSFLGWSRLYVNLDPLDSLFGAWAVGAVELDGFHVTALLQPDGTFSFADIIARLNATSAAPAPSAAPAKPLPAVRLGRLQVRDARLDFVDRSRPRPFTTTLGPVSFNLTGFETTATVGAPYHFEAVTEAAEKLVWSGTLGAVPLASTGELRLENIFLPKYAAYYADRLRAELTDGRLSLSGHYEARFDASTRVLKLLGGALQLRDLKVVESAAQAPVLELPALAVSGVDADALTLKTTIASVALTGGRLQVRRESDGSINLLNLLAPAAGSGATPAPSAIKPGPPPDFQVGELVLKDFAADISDLAAPRPVRLGFTGVQFSLKNVTLADGAVMPLQLELGWSPAGTVKIAGTVALKPELKATLQTDVAALSLLPLSPYLEQFVNARVAQGTVSTQGRVQLASPGGVPGVSFDGDVTLGQFGLVDAAHNAELAGFGSLALKGLKAATAPARTVSLAEVALAAPYARVQVSQDGTLNFAALAKAPVAAASGNGGGGLSPDVAAASPESGGKLPPTPEPTASALQPSAAPLPAITIAKVAITDGDFSFADQSLDPAVRMGVKEFGGTITGLSSENFARATVDLKAAVDGVGPVTIAGQLDPLGAKRFVDLTVTGRNVDLLPLSPYSGKYAGYELARGQLNLDLHARVDDRQLDVTNVITLNQFSFGAPVASPDATKLPVRLGVALLKDTDGRIVIDVPMSGSLDDPSLRLGKVVLRVVVNLLTKAAVSPFALLGSMFGGGGDELAFQEFAAGDSTLRPAETSKLATMTKALAGRPGLSLAIEGGYDGPTDIPELQRRKLAALVRSNIWAARHAVDPSIPPPEQLEIAPEAYAAEVRKLFDEKFPPGAAAQAPVPPAPVVAAPAPGPKKGLIRRMVEVFKPGDKPVAGSAPAPAAMAAHEGSGLTLEEMTVRLERTMAVADDELRALAEARAQRVRDYFLNEGRIAGDRLFLTHGNSAAPENKGPRVFLSLQ